MKIAVKTGLDVLAEKNFKQIKGAKTGLVINQASIDRKLNHAIEIFQNQNKAEVTALFGPQHGLYGTTQDNMIEWQSYNDEKTGVPAYSLYGEHRKPTPDMLEGIDMLILDLAEVGARYYTFLWTAKLCIQACAENNVKMIILDRPNPINGITAEGPVLKREYRSFVGLYEITIRHGMTLGEICTMINNEEKVRCDLKVIPMEGWNRRMWFDETALPWVLPSPNMPTLDTATVYPGGCLVEGTNVSEGRGTCRPFELFGAPFIDPNELAGFMKKFNLPGVFFRPTYFEPTFQKHAGTTCGGVQIHVADRRAFRSVKTFAGLFIAARSLYKEKFRWNDPPYEYEYEKPPIDILWGGPGLREAVDNGGSLEDIDRIAGEGLGDYMKKRDRHLLYSEI